MFRNLRIGSKILTILILVAGSAVGISGFISYQIARNSLEAESFNKLTAVREMKAGQIEDYFQLISDQIVSLSEDRMIIEAMKALDEGLHQIQDELKVTDKQIAAFDNELKTYYQQEYLKRLTVNSPGTVSLSDYWSEDVKTRILQHLYITSNPNKAGSRDKLDNAGDKSSYSRAHAVYHPILRSYLEKFGYYDIFLVDIETGGHVAYSVFKEADYGTSLLNGPYMNTNFAEAYNAARKATHKDFVKLVDFKPYPPSYNAQASFVSSPIYDGNEKIGVLIFQMPIDRINNIMTNNHAWAKVGLGVSGETYIVGEDYKLRNQSRFLIEDKKNYFEMLKKIGVQQLTIDLIKKLNSTIGLQKVQTPGTEAALRGKTGTQIFQDYRGISVLSAYKPLKIKDVVWVIMSEIDEAEAFSHVYLMRINLLVCFSILIVFIAILGLFFSRSLVKPLKSLTENATELAKGNMDIQIDTSGQDEIGTLAQNFNVMRKSIKKLVNELEDINHNLEDKVAERTLDLEKANARVNSIVENSAEAIITIDEDQKIVLYNPAAEKVFNYHSEEVLGKPLTMLLPKQSLNIHEKDVNLFKEEDVNARTMDARRDLAGLRKDGTGFPVEAGICKWEIDGKMFFTAFLRDISERKEMENKLAEAYQTIKEQKDRMEKELNVGREIQMSMLPLIFPAFPARKELDVYAVLESAREVGGDFYDFFFLDDGRFCFVIGDVSGKGVPSALFMAVTKTLIKSRASDDSSTASIITHVNEELSRDNKAYMFVTVFMSILNTVTGEMQYTNAGHNPPYILRKDGSVEVLNQRHGPVVGAVKGLAYKEDTIRLLPGDMAYLYTDGVTEAKDHNNSLFTEKRLEKVLSSRRYASTEDLVKATVEETKKFEQGVEQADDITVMAVEYYGMENKPETQHFEITIKNRLPEIEKVVQSFETFADKQGLEVKIRREMKMVFDEMLNNIISYAFQQNEEHEIEIRISLTTDCLTLVISDDGSPFNPFGLEAPDTDLPLEQRKIGGMGIHLVRKVMDDVLYQRKIEKNVITLTKSIKV